MDWNIRAEEEHEGPFPSPWAGSVKSLIRKLMAGIKDVTLALG